jgi:hypothetical protein
VQRRRLFDILIDRSKRVLGYCRFRAAPPPAARPAATLPAPDERLPATPVLPDDMNVPRALARLPSPPAGGGCENGGSRIEDGGSERVSILRPPFANFAFARRSRVRPVASCLLMALIAVTLRGCATIRVTDPPRSATEQFLMSEATRKAVDQLSAEALRDRAVYVDTSYLISSAYPSPENLFYVAELRNKLLLGGVRLADKREQAQIVLEVRTGGIGIDRLEYLLGIPATYLSGTTVETSGTEVPLTTPELAIVKSTKQYGFASAAFVAYWADTGELVASSGPFIGKTLREDWWILGFGPRTVGDIPPTEK